MSPRLPAHDAVGKRKSHAMRRSRNYDKKPKRKPPGRKTVEVEVGEIVEANEAVEMKEAAAQKKPPI